MRTAATPSEPPGEALRRQARDLVDTLPSIELPTAIAFLEFLRGRGDVLRRGVAAVEPLRPRPATQVDDDDLDQDLLAPDPLAPLAARAAKR